MRQRTAPQERKPLSFRLPPEAIEILERLASDLVASKTDVVVLALTQLEQRPEVKQMANAKRRLLGRQ